MRGFSRLLLGLFLALNLAAGCSTHTTTEREVVYDARTGEPIAVHRETTESQHSDDTGVVSGTVNVIGDALALPFRAVAGLVRAIF
jgi:hypothetical protein